MQTYPYTLVDQKCEHKENMLYLMKVKYGMFDVGRIYMGAGVWIKRFVIMAFRHGVPNSQK